MDNQFFQNDTKSIIAGTQFPVMTVDVEIGTGQEYSENTLLAKNQAGVIGRFGQTVGASACAEYVGILMKDINTTTGAKTTTIYATGEFLESGLVIEAGATIDKLALKDIGIFLR